MHLLITLEGGEAAVRTMRFPVGQPTPPLSVGTAGSWRIQGSGIRPVHLTITFDGQQLYVASAQSDGSTFLNGAAIDERWWLLNPQSELRFGDVRIVVSLAADADRSSSPIGDATLFDPRPPEAPAIGARTSLDAGGHWTERQRLQPEQAFGQRTQFGPLPPSVDRSRIPERHQPTPVPAAQPRAPTVAPPPAATPMRASFSPRPARRRVSRRCS